MQLALAAILWLAVHIGIAGTRLRAPLVSRLGRNGFRGIFSVLSVASLVWLCLSYNAAPTRLLWTAPEWLRWLLALIMLPAFLLLVGSVAMPNPTMAGAEALRERPPRGVLRITRHPMLVAFTIWAAVHMLGNGDTASLLFFGTLLVTTVSGMPSIDAKFLRAAPEAAARLFAATSIVPGAAVAAGRNHFAAGEIPWFVWAIGFALWGAMLAAHPYIIGVSAIG